LQQRWKRLVLRRRFQDKVNKRYNILICPLEWGLGHAARMIPVAAKLSSMGHNVIIASGEEHSALFRFELPGLSYINLSGFKPSYSRFLPQYLSMLFRIPSLLRHIASEHNRLKRIISVNNIDVVISDNRFGLWNRKTTTVYVTHMPLIPFPAPFRFLEPVGVSLHRAVIRRYTFCWIPDLQGEINLSGRLSHSVRLSPNTRFIGILSRFSDSSCLNPGPVRSAEHNTVILSGPEPQRGILKEKLLTILRNRVETTYIFEGKPLVGTRIASSGNIRSYTHLPESEMAKIISDSKCVITRSGYTTIMELVSLGTQALLIPTQGQTEQEYLAEYLSEKGWFSSVSQKELGKEILLPRLKASWPADIVQKSNILLAEALNELLEYLHKDHKAGESCQEPNPNLSGGM
jgi:UDP-N-acetylglucosamine transferase subunit ALG13